MAQDDYGPAHRRCECGSERDPHYAAIAIDDGAPAPRRRRRRRRPRGRPSKPGRFSRSATMGAFSERADTRHGPRKSPHQRPTLTRAILNSIGGCNET
jgi:hypothetical protein